MSALDHATMAESEQVQALHHEIADLRQELANLQARLAERDKKFIDIADTIVTGLDKVEAWVNKAIEARVTCCEAAMCARIAEKFGELLGRISAIDPTQARAAKVEAFRFASEKGDGEPVDLPNPLLPRRAFN
jgi:nitrate reductase assembly molybdenum cofactor insertion protein NarJ